MVERDQVQLREEPPQGGLFRPHRGRIAAGVCRGIARYFGWSATNVRIVFVAVSALSAAFPGMVVYLILWLLMPGEPRSPRSFRVR
jgi:phage shock protein PspC (stress-responsive transcriptional regulator)